MLAHELRNPLAPIRTALYVQRLAGGQGEAGEKARDMMERQVQHLVRMVDDLLDVSRLTRGQVTLRRERVDLARLVRQGAEDHRALLEAAGLTLRLELPPTPVWVAGDRTRLAQALANVLDNARKFTPAGGAVAVRLAADPRGGHAVVTVRDTGAGIEPEMLPRIFDVFAQADRSLDRSRGGLGLGLSVARGLVELHAGTIEAASDGAGRGAEFTIRLPREPEPAAPADGPGPVQAKHLVLPPIGLTSGGDAVPIEAS
jgi:signal transduction histidine kinase